MGLGAVGFHLSVKTDLVCPQTAQIGNVILPGMVPVKEKGSVAVELS